MSIDTPSDTVSRVDESTVAGGPDGTGSKATRILGVLSLVGVVFLALLGLWWSPADRVQGELARNLYVHVPTAMMAYLGCLFTTLGSVMYLWKRSQWWDLTALAGGEIAALFTALALVTGSIWGRPTWGTWWVWDARLTSTAMLMLLLMGYLAIRRVPADPHVRSKRAAVVGVLLVPNVLIVHQSVEWWRTLHQKATILSDGTHSDIGGLMLFTWFVGIVVFGAIFAWLMIHRFRIAWLEEQIEARGLDAAIALRRAEA